MREGALVCLAAISNRRIPNHQPELAALSSRPELKVWANRAKWLQPTAIGNDHCLAVPSVDFVLLARNSIPGRVSIAARKLPELAFNDAQLLI